MPGVRDYHRFMSDEPAAVALSRGRFRLVLGSDVGITAMEVVANGDQTRLDLNDLRGTNRRLDLPRDDSNRSEALFIIGSPTDASEALEGEVVVDTFGADDSKLTVRIRKSEPSVLKGVLAEAAFAAWRQRLADAADSLDQLTSAHARSSANSMSLAVRCSQNCVPNDAEGCTHLPRWPTFLTTWAQPLTS